MRPAPLRSIIGAALAALATCACSIEPAVFTPIAPGVDAPGMDTIPLPASCNAIHAADPTRPSGTYEIDPDGAGGDPPITVACDMLTDSGGWTIVFFPPTTNFSTVPIPYTAGTPRLMADAESALLAYRSATGVSYPDHVRFALPDAWRTTPPFNADAVDLPISVNINGGAPVSTTLRYGKTTFSTKCDDPWVPLLWGRICFVGTKAPFFSGFTHTDNDYCATSLSPFSATPCTDDLRFSIAVR